MLTAPDFGPYPAELARGLAGEWGAALDGEQLAGELSRMVKIERMVDRVLADPRFRDLADNDPRAAGARYGVAGPPEELRYFWDLAGGARAPTFDRYLAFARARSGADRLNRSASSIRDPRMRAWRGRQLGRARADLAPLAGGGAPHIPVCWELSRGCSVGCWFCSVDAQKLSANLAYDSAGAALWQGALEAVAERLGDAAASGFCYLATDPFDNPDYERFLADFHRLLGAWPQTTTALALRDPARTRRLLRLAAEHGCALTRFSVLSLGQLDRIERELTIEELVAVELILQNRESRTPKALAGRARARGPRDGEVLVEGSASCVSGFRINLVDRTVELTSPCLADARSPMGQITFGRRAFVDARGLGDALDELIARFMPAEAPDDRPLRFARRVAFTIDEAGVLLTAPAKRVRWSDPCSRQLGPLIAAGRHRRGEAVRALALCGVPEAATGAAIARLFDAGLLDELEPDRALPLAATGACA